MKFQSKLIKQNVTRQKRNILRNEFTSKIFNTWANKTFVYENIIPHFFTKFSKEMKSVQQSNRKKTMTKEIKHERGVS